MLIDLILAALIPHFLNDLGHAPDMTRTATYYKTSHILNWSLYVLRWGKMLY